MDATPRKPDAARGKRIYRARLMLGLSQQGLAERVGVAKNTVHRWEQGGRMWPQHLKRLADALEITVPQLLEGE